MFFGRRLAVQGCPAIFDGCKPEKMGAIRKPRCRTGRLNAAERRDARERRSNGEVEKVMDGFFNTLLVAVALGLERPFPGHADVVGLLAGKLCQPYADALKMQTCNFLIQALR